MSACLELGPITCPCMRFMWIVSPWKSYAGQSRVHLEDSWRQRRPLFRFWPLRHLQCALSDRTAGALPVAAVMLEALKQRRLRPGVVKRQRANASHCSATDPKTAPALLWNETRSSELSEAAARLEALLQTPVVALGLDISLQNTGYAYVRSDSRTAHVLALGHVRTPRTSGTYQKVERICGEICAAIAAATEERMQEKDRPTPTYVIGVEAYMRHYAPGRFRTSSLFRLAELNTLIAYEMSRRMGVFQEPAHIHPSEARAWFGLSSRANEQNTADDRDSVKEAVFERVRPWLEELHHRSTPLSVDYQREATDDGTQQSRVKAREPTVYDESDAFVVAHYAMVGELERQAMADPSLYFTFLAEYGPLILARARAPEMVADIEILVREWARKKERAFISASSQENTLDQMNSAPLESKMSSSKSSAAMMPDFSRWISQTRLRKAYGARFLDRVERARRFWIRDTIRMHWGLGPQSLEPRSDDENAVESL